MEYRRPHGEAEYEALSAVMATAFANAPEQGRTWIREAGDDQARAAFDGDEVVAGFIRRPMGQWWGGRSVPMLGIATVATAPHARGSGVATALMHEAVREAHVEGFPLSVLFAASFPLYRRAGYELAGSVHAITADLVPLRGTQDLPMRPARPEDEEAIRALQRDAARERNGTLDRTEPMWQRQKRVYRAPAATHVVVRDGRIVGFVTHGPKEFKGELMLVVRDLVAADRDAAQRLLGFLAQHRAQCSQAFWTGDDADPFVTLLNTRRWEIPLRDQWMLRIVDVPRALEARGYPDGVCARLDLEVEDDGIEANHGRWVVEIEGGRAAVRPGGEGSLRTTIRGLAPLYSGFLPPASLRRAGWIDADDAACAAASAAFAGSAPFMVEQF